MMRSFVDEKQNPLLWSSTYHAGEHLDPVAVSESKAKRKAKKQGSVPPQSLSKQRQGSSRHLMALLNDNGFVTKAWPVHSVHADGKPIVGHPAEDGIGIPMYGPLKIGKAEFVNLQFGKFRTPPCPVHAGLKPG